MTEKKKERKPQTGATNIGGTPRLTPIKISISSSTLPSLNDSPMVKTISYAITESARKPKEDRAKRQVPGSSTWGGKPITGRKFITEHQGLFIDPIDRPSDEHLQFLKPLPGFETARKAQRDGSVLKLMALAKSKRFGTVSTMLTCFKYHPGTYIEFNDFSQHLRKRNIDEHFGPDEQKLVFEKFDPGRGEKIAVDDLLEYIAEKSISSSVQNRDELEVTADLLERMAQAKKIAKLQVYYYSCADKPATSVHPDPIILFPLSLLL